MLRRSPFFSSPAIEDGNDSNYDEDDENDEMPIVFAQAVPIDDPFTVAPPAQAVAVPIPVQVDQGSFAAFDGGASFSYSSDYHNNNNNNVGVTRNNRSSPFLHHSYYSQSRPAPLSTAAWAPPAAAATSVAVPPPYPSNSYVTAPINASGTNNNPTCPGRCSYH